MRAWQASKLLNPEKHLCSVLIAVTPDKGRRQAVGLLLVATLLRVEHALRARGHARQHFSGGTTQSSQRPQRAVGLTPTPSADLFPQDIGAAQNTRRAPGALVRTDLRLHFRPGVSLQCQATSGTQRCTERDGRAQRGLTRAALNVLDGCQKLRQRSAVPRARGHACLEWRQAKQLGNVNTDRFSA